MNGQPKEGELFKEIRLHGTTFRLYYGYYEECDRQNPLVEPVPIYPDLSRLNRCAEGGFPFVTKMQDACVYFKGSAKKDADCGACAYYGHGEDLIGICVCEKNKKLKKTISKKENGYDKEIF